MSFEDSVYTLKRPFYLAVSSVLLLVAGFVADILTPQELVVAITYNVAIALAGLVLSRNFTYAMLAGALLGNIIAGIINAGQGTYDIIAVLNRVLAALSFLLVGYMTLELSRITMRLTTLGFEQARTEREDALRKFFAEVSGPFRTQDFLERTSRELRSLLQADTVVIVGVSQNRFALPRVTDPETSGLGKLGETVPWVVAATPTNDIPTLSARVDTDLMTVGRWRRQNDYDLVVIARRPKVKQPELLLGEALRNLEPLYEQAKLLENTDKQNIELARRNTVIRDLVYAFSHDIRTPLMATAMNMQQALEGAFGPLPEDYKHTLQNGLSANKDLLDLADSLLLVARYESGEEAPQVETLDAAASLRDVVAQQRDTAAARHIRIDLDAPNTLTMLGRDNELKRVTQNLLANAIKFSPNGGCIDVNLKRFDDYLTKTNSSAQGLQLEVLDKGAGVSKEQEARLFQRFSSGRAGGGIGLGLYLAKQIVEAHHGRIYYEPREGGGSRFVVWLPLAAELVTN
jgi:signal transduction histidine kinase